MKLVFQTRFAFVGQLGWQSRTANNPQAVFDPAYIAARASLMEKLFLASICDQTDDDFHVQVLTSSDLPEHAKADLYGLCAAALGEERFTLIEQGPLRSWNVMHQQLVAEFGENEPVALVALDDDDAVAVDFVELCRGAAQSQHDAAHFGGDHSFLAFTSGARVVLQDGAILDASLETRRGFVPGQTYVGRAGDRQNTMINRARFHALSRSCEIRTDRPMYLKTLHANNDREAPIEDIVQIAQLPDGLDTYFPILFDIPLAAHAEALILTQAE
ncbi:MAG: glycosyltransferase [Planktomarina sp.]